jgi:hypothetical protein
MVMNSKRVAGRFMKKNHNEPEVPYVIFEDDFDSDSDGPAALCMLLELEAAGECKIIACGTSELHEDSTSTMAATLHYFGRGDIPLGSYRDDLWPYDPATTQLYDESLFCQTWLPTHSITATHGGTGESILMPSRFTPMPSTRCRTAPRPRIIVAGGRPTCEHVS